MSTSKSSKQGPGSSSATAAGKKGQPEALPSGVAADGVKEEQEQENLPISPSSKKVTWGFEAAAAYFRTYARSCPPQQGVFTAHSTQRTKCCTTDSVVCLPPLGDPSCGPLAFSQHTTTRNARASAPTRTHYWPRPQSSLMVSLGVANLRRRRVKKKQAEGHLQVRWRFTGVACLSGEK